MSIRKTVIVPVDSIDAEDFFPSDMFTLADMKALVDQLYTKDKDQDQVFQYQVSYHGYEGAFQIKKYEVRPESELEYQTRLKKEEQDEKRRKIKEQKEYEKYLALKAKFESDCGQ